MITMGFPFGVGASQGRLWSAGPAMRRSKRSMKKTEDDQIDDDDDYDSDSDDVDDDEDCDVGHDCDSDEEREEQED